MHAWALNGRVTGRSPRSVRRAETIWISSSVQAITICITSTP